ncbi:Uncharacterized protein HZ326_15326 [Fusarium oxysporum f. sp. albedinis]|nr:Uncharacterized protein HZ326_15326 [Fusarium oxysporum f. sp. albedinis]
MAERMCLGFFVTLEMSLGHKTCHLDFTKERCWLESLTWNTVHTRYPRELIRSIKRFSSGRVTALYP